MTVGYHPAAPLTGGGHSRPAWRRFSRVWPGVDWYGVARKGIGPRPGDRDADAGAGSTRPYGGGEIFSGRVGPGLVEQGGAGIGMARQQHPPPWGRGDFVVWQGPAILGADRWGSVGQGYNTRPSGGGETFPGVVRIGPPGHDPARPGWDRPGTVRQQHPPLRGRGDFRGGARLGKAWHGVVMLGEVRYGNNTRPSGGGETFEVGHGVVVLGWAMLSVVRSDKAGQQHPPLRGRGDFVVGHGWARCGSARLSKVRQQHPPLRGRGDFQVGPGKAMLGQARHGRAWPGNTTRPVRGGETFLERPGVARRGIGGAWSGMARRGETHPPLRGRGDFDRRGGARIGKVRHGKAVRGDATTPAPTRGGEILGEAGHGMVWPGSAWRGAARQQHPPLRGRGDFCGTAWPDQDEHDEAVPGNNTRPYGGGEIL